MPSVDVTSNGPDVSSSLIDEDASSGNRTVLNRDSLEKFLQRRLGSDRPWWRIWER